MLLFARDKPNRNDETEPTREAHTSKWRIIVRCVHVFVSIYKLKSLLPNFKFGYLSGIFFAAVIAIDAPFHLS